MATGIGGLSFDELTGKLRNDLRNIYRQHIHPYYEPHERDGALQLLLTAQVDGGNTAAILFKSSRSFLTQVGAPYEFVGIGRDLAYYFMKKQRTFATKQDLRLYDPESEDELPRLEDALPTVRTVMREIQENVPYCGQGARILIVPHDGEPSYELTE